MLEITTLCTCSNSTPLAGQPGLEAAVHLVDRAADQRLPGRPRRHQLDPQVRPGQEPVDREIYAPLQRRPRPSTDTDIGKVGVTLLAADRHHPAGRPAGHL